MLRRTLLLLCSSVLAILPLSAQRHAPGNRESVRISGCPMVKIGTERLPDMNVPRVGNVQFMAGGEPVVVGGHTTGFVPTPTAEYYADGAWHLIETPYSHDDGFGVKLSSGKVLIGGGHEKHLGIGQSHPTEVYDPTTHTFGDYGCLDTKRAIASGAEIDSGRVVIAGNWYRGDSIELYDGAKHFTFVKEPTVDRSAPYILRIARDEVLIFGGYDTKGNKLDSACIVDRLHGAPIVVPLLSEYGQLPSWTIPMRESNCEFIGDAEKDVFAYLLFMGANNEAFQPAVQQDGKGQYAVVMVQDTVFTPLPTSRPIPSKTPDGTPIAWFTPVIADRQAQCGYVCGFDKAKRLYVLRIDYSSLWAPDGSRLCTAAELKAPLPLTLFHTDPLPACGFNIPMLTADGNLLIAGGNYQVDASGDNYQPYSTVWLIRLNGHADGAAKSVWPWVAVLLLAAAALGALLLWRRRRSPYIYNKVPEEPAKADSTAEPDVQAVQPTLSVSASEQLMGRICQLMDERQMFRNSELKVSDVATALATNTRYVTDCIKTCRGCTFTQFVNGYRIDYAKQLLRQHPDKKITEVYMESGFASETSFFRIFKAHTGMTTREWMQQEAASL